MMGSRDSISINSTSEQCPVYENTDVEIMVLASCLWRDEEKKKKKLRLITAFRSQALQVLNCNVHGAASLAVFEGLRN
jgi:hypothetical protein